MSSHAGPPEIPDGPPVPEPSYAERARTMVYMGRIGTLSTLSRKHSGYPFGSVMPYALDGQGRPLFLISTMAMHTQNLQADRRASLLVTQPGWVGDPLAGGRATLLGEVRTLSKTDSAEVRDIYLARHPNAAYWVDFEDFGFYRMEVVEVYYVGGFAAMDWISAQEYLEARPDPLAESAAGIIEHMNRDHPDALVAFARVLGGAQADEASMVSVDRLGFKLRIKSGVRLSSVRIPFPREVTNPEETRAVLIAMLRDARGSLGGGHANVHLGQP